MVGMFGLWKMLKTVFSLLVDFSSSFPSSHFQPPLYFSWSSHFVGKPVPGFVSTLFHHMYSVPLRSVQMFLHAMLQVWHPMHLSRWNTIAICERTSMARLPVAVTYQRSSGSLRTRTCVSRLQPTGP